MGKQRYERAGVLAREVGVDISIFDAFAPWFVAEAISQLQLQQLGFQPQSGVEMFFWSTRAAIVNGGGIGNDPRSDRCSMPCHGRASRLLGVEPAGGP